MVFFYCASAIRVEGIFGDVAQPESEIENKVKNGEGCNNVEVIGKEKGNHVSYPYEDNNHASVISEQTYFTNVKNWQI